MSFLHSLVYLPHLPIVDISSVCSLIDRTEIKINICTIPTLHPLVSIRSSLLCSALTIPHTPSHHPPWNKSVQDNWAALSLWNEGWDMERERLQLWAAHWWYLSLHCFVFSRSLFYVGLTGNCAAVIQDQGEREREGEREGKVLNCCNKLQISHRLSINVIKTQSTNTQLTVKAKTHLCRFTFQKWPLFRLFSTANQEFLVSGANGAIFQQQVVFIHIESILLHNTKSEHTWCPKNNYVEQNFRSMRFHWKQGYLQLKKWWHAFLILINNFTGSDHIFV